MELSSIGSVVTLFNGNSWTIESLNTRAKPGGTPGELNQRVGFNVRLTDVGDATTATVHYDLDEFQVLSDLVQTPTIEKLEAWVTNRSAAEMPVSLPELVLLGLFNKSMFVVDQLPKFVAIHFLFDGRVHLVASDEAFNLLASVDSDDGPEVFFRPGEVGMLDSLADRLAFKHADLGHTIVRVKDFAERVRPSENPK